ncbi:MFS transporter [Kiloniella sp. EL199]|uniref:MFS transporter n=1 Tax=Kiloniella sp. EL199 TaxID=2107581 RepID=UPI000EA064BC|nr:MFS transporter [Kiloniella sp. EL199]
MATHIPTEAITPKASTNNTKMTRQNILHLVIVCMGVALYALNSLITSTLLPSAVDDLNGLEFINWSALLYTTAAMIASLATGTTKTRIGGRAILSIGGSVFAVGSLLVSLSPSMEMFLLSRIVQGVGGGLVLASCYTVIADLFPRHLWPTVFAMESAVWGIASVGGPLAGGIFAQTVGWRAGFYIITVCAFLFVILVRSNFPKKETNTASRETEIKTSLPFFRLGLLGSAVLIIAMGNREPDYAWAFLIIGLVLLGYLLHRDKKSNSSLLPKHGLSLFTVAGTGVMIIFLAMVSSISFMVYGPYILQKVHGFSPLAAGFMVALESISWTAAALICARLPQNNRWRLYLIPTGVFTAFLGLFGIALFLYGGPLWSLTISIFLAGAGFGIFWADLSSVIIESGPIDEQDKRSGAIPTLQMCGGALGPAIAGIPAAVIGFQDGANHQVVEQTAYWVHAIFLPVLFIASLLAIYLVKLKNRDSAKIVNLAPETSSEKS